MTPSHHTPCKTATRPRRARALREILNIISQSRDDEQAVFDAKLRSATKFGGTPNATLVLGREVNAAQAQVVGTNATPESREIYRSGKVPMDLADSLAARAIIECRTIHVHDMAATEEYRAGHERFVLPVERQGLRTCSYPFYHPRAESAASLSGRRKWRPSRQTKPRWSRPSPRRL